MKLPKLPKLTKLPKRMAKQTCVNSAPRWMMIVAFGLISLLALALVYQFMLKPIIIGHYERYEDVKSNGTLVLAHMHGCGWCKRMMPEWNRLKAEHGATFADAGIEIKEVEAGETDKIKPYKSEIQGYPTILFVHPDGKIVKYDGDRTAEALLEFVQAQGVTISAKKQSSAEADKTRGADKSAAESFEDGKEKKGLWRGLAGSVSDTKDAALKAVSI